MNYKFGTEKAQAIYDAAAADPNYLSLSGELALMKTAMQMCLAWAKNQGKLDNGELKPDFAAYIAGLAKDVASVADSCSRIEKGMSFHVSIEGLDAFLGNFLHVLGKETGDQELVERMAAKIADMDIPIGDRRPLADTSNAFKNRDVPDAYVEPEDEGKEAAAEEGVDEG